MKLKVVKTEMEASGKVVPTTLHKIMQKRLLTESTFVLRLEREQLEFKAGQHIIVGLEGALDQREYSIYSGQEEDWIEILVKEILDGKVSFQLKHSKPGELLQINGPFGTFGLEKFEMFSKKLVFVATGTGIAPFHSFVKSYPGIDYVLFHGVRYNSEAYERNNYEPSRYMLCTSKESNGGNKGRVTRFLRSYPLSENMLFYLCGNNNMIYEVHHILTDRGVPEENIFSEVYF